MRKFYIIVSLKILFTSNNLIAGGIDNFVKYAARGGSMTSVNKGSVISDQKSGHMIGGSIISRGPRPMELQPLSVRLPSFEFDGCTGSFDIRWGGFSYIKGRQFAEYFKSVATSAAAYVFKMALKSVNPISEDIMSYLETVARDVNGMTFNQCEQGKALAEGLVSKFNASNQQKCMAKSSIVKGGSDLVESTQKCQDDPSRYGESGDDKELKSMLPDNFNLVWHALSKGDGAAPTGMKELMMSITGSIIGLKEDGATVIRTLPSLVEKEDLIEQYIGKAKEGQKKVKVYVCDNKEKCLHPNGEEQLLSDQETLYGKVESTLISLLRKIHNDNGELSDEEQALVEFSQIPIITYLEIELATRNKNSVENNISGGSDGFVDAICYDMIINFMQKMLQEVKSSVDLLKTAQLDNTAIERFNNNIKSVQLKLRDKNFEAMRKLQTIISVKERMMQQQNLFEMNFGRFGDSRW